MTGVSLLTYADRLAGDLAGLRDLLEGELAVFTGVHILPFFTPFDGDDTGFDPVDHGAVDPRLGGWADVRSIAANADDHRFQHALIGRLPHEAVDQHREVRLVTDEHHAPLPSADELGDERDRVTARRDLTTNLDLIDRS